MTWATVAFVVSLFWLAISTALTIMLILIFVATETVKYQRRRKARSVAHGAEQYLRGERSR